MNKSLKEILENVYVSSKELKENNESTQFKEIATHRDELKEAAVAYIQEQNGTKAK